jgi:hypothetical protein
VSLSPKKGPYVYRVRRAHDLERVQLWALFQGLALRALRQVWRLRSQGWSPQVALQHVRYRHMCYVPLTVTGAGVGSTQAARRRRDASRGRLPSPGGVRRPLRGRGAGRVDSSPADVGARTRSADRANHSLPPAWPLSTARILAHSGAAVHARCSGEARWFRAIASWLARSA